MISLLSRALLAKAFAKKNSKSDKAGISGVGALLGLGSIQFRSQHEAGADSCAA